MASADSGSGSGATGSGSGAADSGSGSGVAGSGSGAAAAGDGAAPGVVALDAVPWVLSGRGAEGLRGQAARLAKFMGREAGLAADPGSSRDVGLSLLRRPLLDSRAVVVGDERTELLAGLGALAEGAPGASAVSGVLPAGGAGGVVFVFPGQGSQWRGMALELLERSEVFAAAPEASARQALAPFLEWSLEEVLRGAEGAPELERVDVVQPALFAVMVALAGLWERLRGAPGCGGGPLPGGDRRRVRGGGPVAAGRGAGGRDAQPRAASTGRSRRDGVARDGRAGGRGADRADRKSSLSWRVDRGDQRPSRGGGLRRAARRWTSCSAACEAEGVRARRIAVDYAAHSRQVEEIREELLEGCAGIAPRAR